MKSRLVYLLAWVFCFPLFFSPEAAAQSAGGGYQMKKIVLDAGHGGRDPGAVAGNVREKDIVLAVTLRVGELIDQNLPGVEVIYTRKTDVLIDLNERGRIANRADADLFVSIHADAADNRNANGSSSWVMGLSREQSNLELAMRENSVITYEEDYQTKYESFDPTDPASYIMFSLMQSVHLDQSIKLAGIFQKHYKENTTISTTRGVRQNIFLVLVSTTMPSVLTEIGFISNANDRAYMNSKAGQEKIARSIFNAISEYKSMVEGNARIITLDNAGNRQNAAAPAAQATTGTSADASPATPQTPAFVTAAEHSGPVFRVQVSASRTPVARNRFGAYANQVVEKRIGSYYKYFVGETNSYSEAVSLQRQVRNTFRDAFIVAFDGEEPVTLTDEMKKN